MKIVDRFEQFWCALKGHHALKTQERERVFLRCLNCQWESAGWDLRQSAKKKVLLIQTRVDSQWRTARQDLPRRAVGR